MKTVKKLTWSLVVVVLVSSFVMAYPPKSADERIQHMKERLELTDEQVAKILPILQEIKEKRQELFENKKAQARDNFRTQMKQIMEKNDSRISALLNEEQKEKWERSRKKRWEKREARMKSRRDEKQKSGRNRGKGHNCQCQDA